MQWGVRNNLCFIHLGVWCNPCQALILLVMSTYLVITWPLMLKPTVLAWCGCRIVSMVTSRTCVALGWGQVAWQPGRLPASVAHRTLGAPLSSSTDSGRRNTGSQLAGVEEREFFFGSALFLVWLKCRHGYVLKFPHTRGSEEGLRQLVVSRDLPDLGGDVDESTNHRRDPVKAQHSDINKTKGSRQRESARIEDTSAPFFFEISILLVAVI